MRYFCMLVAAALLSACGSIDNQTSASGRGKFQKTRVTYYRKGEDKYGSRIAMSSKMRAQEGKTVAAENSIPFGSKLKIPALIGVVGTGLFEVQDRGRDVNHRKASHGAYPVIDVFVASRKKYRWLIHHMEPMLDVLSL
jgi:uncharacterized protein YceK